MPRDSNGNYTLPAGNPVASGTPISSTVQNSTMNDLAAAITGSLSRNGLGGMQTALPFVSGAVGNPGITWVNELTSGLYLAAVNDMRVTVAGADNCRWTLDWMQLWDGAVWSNVVTEVTAAEQLAFYPLKGGAETITGTWVFPNGTTMSAGGTLKLANAANTFTATLGVVGTELDLSATTIGFNSGATQVAQVQVNGFTIYSGKNLQLNNAANNANQTLHLGSANEIVIGSRGGVHGWNDANLPRGSITLSITAPAANGNPGDIVYVYE